MTYAKKVFLGQNIPPKTRLSVPQLRKSSACNSYAVPLLGLGYQLLATPKFQRSSRKCDAANMKECSIDGTIFQPNVFAGGDSEISPTASASGLSDPNDLRRRR